jgi:tRNA-specific 2-thiouridylase
MLWSLSQEQLSKVIFPLGELTKAEAREIAVSLSFENAHKKDSQDVCFIPEGDYAKFIELYTGTGSIAGNYIDMNGKIIGKHKGIIHYTIGQRKGLGIALGQPMFVHSKSIENNTVTLCKNEELFGKTIIATDINLISVDKISAPMKVLAKARYGQKAVPATVEQTDEHTLKIEFDEPIRAISPGQSVVLYDGDVVVGGGIIK